LASLKFLLSGLQRGHFRGRLLLAGVELVDLFLQRIQLSGDAAERVLNPIGSGRRRSCRESQPPLSIGP
jgi:hypothetical protein